MAIANPTFQGHGVNCWVAKSTAPYMHDGSLANLAEVIEFHNQGGFANPFLDAEMRPLGLNQKEKSDLLAFMEALTSSQFADANYFKQNSMH
ncbi:hypothetical protein [Methylicorpusculum sp.]|uniref:hypothetical protein n=1 Tax=Methylicorpusculum sp. TaxID=2713644 RepID=UPI002730D7C7|nr:hypothetical protein [Methylicorpusculum sp.]MDP2177654.1 hypothetical protein [Methylicorpusculum sp.]MDP3528598.1 hypothetical protein [Methylicorpusculum sp.]